LGVARILAEGKRDDLSTRLQDSFATTRAYDRSRRIRIAVAIVGVAWCLLITLTFQEKALGILFGLAFALAWWSEIADRRPTLVALGAAAVLAGTALRLGWESALFVFVFVAIWHLAANRQLTSA
jgi:hypothetical protein